MVEVKPGVYRDQPQGKVWEVEVFYSLNGMNYFLGNINKRGVYVMITPKEVNGFASSFTLLGENSGMKMLLEELPRKSQKALVIWQERIKTRFDNLIETAKTSGMHTALTSLKSSLNLA